MLSFFKAFLSIEKMNGSSKIYPDIKLDKIGSRNFITVNTIPEATDTFFFRQTQLLESHVSGHMVKKEITAEGEVRVAMTSLASL